MKKRERLPDLLIERLALNELPNEEREAIEREAGSSVGEELARIEVSNEEILAEYPADEMAQAILKRMEGEQTTEKEKVIPFPVTRIAIPIAAAAVLALAFGIIPNLNREEVITEAPVSMERVKGLEPSLTIFREGGDGAESLYTGAVAAENDRLQIEYNAAGKRFGVIFSIDGRGAVSLHFPDFVGASNILDNAGRVALPFSYQLDDAPEFERFFFVSSDASFDVSEILDIAQDMASDLEKSKNSTLPLPETYRQVSVLIEKEQ